MCFLLYFQVPTKFESGMKNAIKKKGGKLYYLQFYDPLTSEKSYSYAKKSDLPWAQERELVREKLFRCIFYNLKWSMKRKRQKSYSDAKSILQAFRKDNCSKKSYSYDQSRILVADLS